MIRLHNQNRTHTFIDVESGQFISLPKDETDKPPVNADVNGLMIYGKTIQDGEPAPDNPVDIVNIPPEFNLTVCGKNLFNKETRTLSMWVSRRGATGSSEISDTTDYIRVEPNTNYFLSGHPNRTSQEIAFYDINKTIITELEGISVASDNGLKTTPSNCYFIRFSMAKTDVATVQFEKGSVATPYQPYQGSTYPYRIEDLDGNLHELCSLPDGTADSYDRDNGVLIKRTKSIVLDGSESGWRLYIADELDDYIRFYNDVVITDDEKKLGNENGLNGNALCSHFKNGRAWNTRTFDNLFSFSNTASWIWFKIAKSELTGYSVGLTNAQKVDLFKTWLSQNPVTVLYKLAEPVTYQIKRYGKTYDGQVWDKNEKPKSIQYHTNIFTDVGAEMQCEMRKLGNRKMGEFYWVTENGDKIITEDEDYIMFEY